ncbi:MAG: class I SAM-dependent methyltransferase [Planctomycetota bacterium]|jgi:SAM-dependent methyltransferase
MIERAEERLRKVYPALARTIVTEFGMEEVEGIGLDVGGGPGRLALELSKLTPKMKWVNVDINKHFFPHFFEEAAGEGVRERVDATEADVVKLPFEDGFADFVVSRGSYKYWEGKEAAFREIHRVLKPGGVAYVGRGFPDTLPVDEARKIRSSQRKRRRNPLGDDSAELRELLRDLPLDGFWIWTPQPPGFEERVYGLWLKFKKPAVAADGGGQQGPAPQ